MLSKKMLRRKIRSKEDARVSGAGHNCTIVTMYYTFTKREKKGAVSYRHKEKKKPYYSITNSSTIPLQRTVLYHYKELAASVAVEIASAAAVETDSAALSAALFKEGLADGKRNST